MKFGTKAETLELILPVIKSAEVLPQVRLSVKEWNSTCNEIVKKVMKNNWHDIDLIVRSSAINEDSCNQSLAGHFLSIANVKGIEKYR